MPPFILYVSESIICLGAFMMIYYLLLRRETYFQWNRLYLIGSAITATILPLIHLPVTNPQTGSNLPTQWLSTVTVTTSTAEKSISSSLPDSSLLISLLLATVSLFFLFRLIFHFSKMITLKRNGTLIYRHGFPLICSPKVQTPFSFLGTIYLPLAKPETDDKIIRHEMAHIIHRHSLDILLLKLLQIVQWANPFYYLLIQELRTVHEFQADDHVLREGTDIRAYQNVLLQNCFDTPTSFLSNSFYFSNIKTRCTMMTQSKNKRPAVLKTIATLPIILTLLIAGIACERQASDEDNVSATSSAPKGQEQKAPQTAESDSIYRRVANMPAFPGGKGKLKEYLNEVNYPQEAKSDSVEGSVVVKFVINKSGNVEDVEAARQTGTMLDSVATAHVRKMPQWTPGKNADGKIVNVRYYLPFKFKMENEDQ